MQGFTDAPFCHFHTEVYGQKGASVNLENYQLDWINTHVEGSFGSQIASDYNLFATPTMFLIDAEYNIIAKPLTLEELKNNIMELK